MSEQQTEVKPEKKPEKKLVRKPASEHSGWYTFLRGFMQVMSHSFAPVRYTGVENLPEKGPYMVICNHDSMMDPLLVAAAIRKEAVTFMGKKELVKNPLMHHILLDLHMIIVDRHNSDMEAMRACTKAIRAGEILGIFPEGTRHKQGLMEDLESGAGLIALRANVPLIPFYITPKFRFFRRTRVIIGKPIDFSDLLAQGVNKETNALLLARITETYRAMAAESTKKA